MRFAADPQFARPASDFLQFEQALSDLLCEFTARSAWFPASSVDWSHASVLSSSLLEGCRQQEGASCRQHPNGRRHRERRSDRAGQCIAALPLLHPRVDRLRHHRRSPPIPDYSHQNRQATHVVRLIVCEREPIVRHSWCSSFEGPPNSWDQKLPSVYRFSRRVGKTGPRTVIRSARNGRCSATMSSYDPRNLPTSASGTLWNAGTVAATLSRPSACASPRNGELAASKRRPGPRMRGLARLGSAAIWLVDRRRKQDPL